MSSSRWPHAALGCKASGTVITDGQSNYTVDCSDKVKRPTIRSRRAKGRVHACVESMGVSTHAQNQWACPSICPESDTEFFTSSKRPKDIVYILKITRWILNSIGIWPSLLENSNPFLQKIVIGLCNVILMFAIIPFSLYLSIDVKDLVMRLKLIGLFSYCSVALMKYWTLTACKPNLKYCIEMVQHDWKQVRDYIHYCGFHDSMTNMSRSIAKESKDLRKQFLFCLKICSHFILLVHFDELEKKIQLYLGRSIELFYPKNNFIALGETFQSLYYSVYYFARLQSHLLLLDSGFCAIMTKAYCNFLVARQDWEVNNTLGLITNTVLLLSLMFNIFILCYIGDLLVEKTGDVGSLCFMIDWYKFPAETMRSLILIIAISINPAKITAGNIADLNLSTFGGILKTSLAYLSFLRTAAM
ncbi:uncharacterized protein LOC143353021 [Halictus rubicundus]|uniref:uncharacterized protein LOC143353021 n=1 Tax=Halictus rubicundus TaxID=77578 RepID=UPI00403630B1